MSDGEHWRLLKFAEVDGPTSAAIDEALLEAVGQGESPPTLRLYTWTGSWLSIGSSQSVAADVDLRACEQLGVQLVRRGSGGKAVLNEQMVGFSVVVPASHELSAGGIMETYRRIAPALLRGLGSLAVHAQSLKPQEVRFTWAPPTNATYGRACFSGLVAYELLWHGRKLVGNAQVRRRSATLHHGLVFLDFDAERMASVLQTNSDAERADLASFLDATVATLRQAMGSNTPEPEELAVAFEEGFRYALRADLALSALSEPEQEMTRSLRLRKYANEEWTHRR